MYYFMKIALITMNFVKKFAFIRKLTVLKTFSSLHNCKAQAILLLYQANFSAFIYFLSLYGHEKNLAWILTFHSQAHD